MEHSNVTESIDKDPCQAENAKIVNNQNPSFSFSTVVHIPPEFNIVSARTPQMVYCLNQLRIHKETCKKTIQVEEQGETIGCMKVELQSLKICGYIPVFLNIEIQPTTKTGCYSFGNSSKPLYISVKDIVTIDHVLKYSVEDLPHYVIDDHHVKLQSLHVTSLGEESDRFARITGHFQLLYG
ncbi:hypothetical protein NPM06_23950 [Bacillus cereus]|uniref:hypothetical protein n=1 Tax=Bacillus cereus TaxID=1396 RepID=UPI0021128A13|nr:hypothetical protein [Bacillus cereus]